MNLMENRYAWLKEQIDFLESREKQLVDSIERLEDRAKMSVASLRSAGSVIMTMMGGAPLLSEEEIVLSASKVESHAGIYFLIRENRVIYVGQSANVTSRVLHHRYTGKDFDKAAYVQVEPEFMDAIEAAYIDRLRPELNKFLPNVVEKSRPNHTARCSVALASATFESRASLALPPVNEP